jgi:chromosome segregation ATPase
MESAKQMREAADAMRRAAAGGNGGSSAQAQQALDRLKETQRKLERSLSDRADRDIKDAQARAAELARQQQEIANGVSGLSANGETRRDQAQRINEKKDDLETKLGELENDLEAAARDAAQQERQASR